MNVQFDLMKHAWLCLGSQIPQEEAPAKKLRLSKPSKSAALHIDLCKATNSTDALQYLLHFARKPVEAESVEGVIRILLEHYYKVNNQNCPVWSDLRGRRMMTMLFLLRKRIIQ